MSEESVERARQLAKQLICKHPRTSGGNDFTACNDCGLEWDYGKADSLNAIRALQPGFGADSEKRETVKAIVARIDSLTGPTGGWLDSPKRLKAEIEAEFGGSGTGGK